jgi:hypothetical protein
MTEGVSFYIQHRVPKRGESPNSRPPRQKKNVPFKGMFFLATALPKKGKSSKLPVPLWRLYQGNLNTDPGDLQPGAGWEGIVCNQFFNNGQRSNLDTRFLSERGMISQQNHFTS